MKKIGRTDGGNVLVEMSELELRAFVRLVNCVEGKGLNYDLSIWDMSNMPKEGNLPDLTNVFDMITAFAFTNYRLSELDDALYVFRNALQKKEV